MNMGVFLLNNGHYKRAGAHFDKVIAIQAEHSDALVGRALVMSAEGRANEASTALEEVLRKNGDSALVLTLLTQITREHLKDYTRAARYVERMLALQNSDRRTLEQAVTMKQELKRLMETNSKNYSDENLRKMADHSPAASHQAAREVTSAQSDSQNDELHKLEESIK
jgi:tetratricopeptide (TPR) repeat protein